MALPIMSVECYHYTLVTSVRNGLNYLIRKLSWDYSVISVEFLYLQVYLLWRLHEHQLWSALDSCPHKGSLCGRYTNVWVVHSCPHLCLKYHTLFWRHLPGWERNAQKRSVLDKFGVLCPLQHRDDAQMARTWLLEILHQLLDNPRLHHCVCK